MQSADAAYHARLIRYLTSGMTREEALIERAVAHLGAKCFRQAAEDAGQAVDLLERTLQGREAADEATRAMRDASAAVVRRTSDSVPKGQQVMKLWQSLNRKAAGGRQQYFCVVRSSRSGHPAGWAS